MLSDERIRELAAETICNREVLGEYDYLCRCSDVMVAIKKALAENDGRKIRESCMYDPVHGMVERYTWEFYHCPGCREKMQNRIKELEDFVAKWFESWPREE